MSTVHPTHARLAQSAERKALNLVVVGSSPTVGVFLVPVTSSTHVSSKGKQSRVCQRLLHQTVPRLVRMFRLYCEHQLPSYHSESHELNSFCQHVKLLRAMKKPVQEMTFHSLSPYDSLKLWHEASGSLLTYALMARCFTSHPPAKDMYTQDALNEQMVS